jgi:hypothetical protein
VSSLKDTARVWRALQHTAVRDDRGRPFTRKTIGRVLPPCRVPAGDCPCCR